ncbi:hypothetical protein STEG23_006708, partial [Scotinomys teguina]
MPDYIFLFLFPLLQVLSNNIPSHAAIPPPLSSEKGRQTSHVYQPVIAYQVVINNSERFKVCLLFLMLSTSVALPTLTLMEVPFQGLSIYLRV